MPEDVETDPRSAARNLRETTQVLKALGPQMKTLAALSQSVRAREELADTHRREQITTVGIEDLEPLDKP